MREFGVSGSGLDGSYEKANAHRKKLSDNSDAPAKGLGEEEQAAAAKRKRGKQGLEESPERSEEDNALAESFNTQAEDASYVLPGPDLLKKGSSSKQMMTDYQLE